ncbi:hypothetical protein K523DRAFT_21065 [Schizophyllum commune Tattone D]|nr:hypothetical protein K523DRAFT_21065 [Schizophyllum commune Tattone D]
MANVETPRSPSVQSFASADTVSISFTSIPGSPAMSPVSDDAAARATHEETGVPAQSHRFYLDVRSVKLKLDDGTFYHVHRHFFERHAPRFAEQYLCGETQDIIEVHDVSSVDFQRFLSIIYPSDLGVCDIHIVDEWTSVLRLASKWSVISLRDVAIREIETLRPTPIDTVVIAREFGLGEAWLVPAFVALCKSMEPLGFEDAEALGFRSAIEIARIKELNLRSGDSYDVETAVRDSDVLLPLGVDSLCPRPTFELAPATPIRVAIPTFDILPPSMVIPAPVDSYEPDHRPVLDHGHPTSSDNHLPSDVDDNLAYLTMLASDHAEERLLIRKWDPSGVYRGLLALRIARRLVIETTNAAIRHRYWRHMWPKAGGYAASRNETVDEAMEVDVRIGEESAYSSVCRAITKLILARLDLVTRDNLVERRETGDVLNVQVHNPLNYDLQYSKADCVEDIKRLLDREGFSWSQDVDHATCIRVEIPLPSRDWFVDGL